jgi:group I intron endonuclease
MRQTGIYKISSIIKPNNIYIGSAIDIISRKQKHLSELKLGKHKNNRLQNHVNKYGVDDLTFSVLEPCFPDWLLAREQEYIDNLKPYFNICKIAGNTLGIKFSEEAKKKISMAKKGKPGRKLSYEEIQKIKERTTGRIFSLETKAKLSASRKGKGYGFKKGYKPSNERNSKQSITMKLRYPNGVHSPELCKIIGLKNKGRIMTEEQKEKLRIANTGRKHTQEARMKMSELMKGKTGGEKNPMYGKKHTIESKEKNRISHMGKTASRETKAKLSLMRKGKKFSDEHKMRLSLSIKQSIARKKELENRIKKIA